MSNVLRVALAISTALAAGSTAAYAQAVDFAFPQGVTGFDKQIGVTVQTRLRPQYDAPGIQVGGFNIRPNLDQTILYNTNPLGDNGRGSFVSQTAANVTAGSNWSRNSLAATVGVNHVEYLSLPIQYTDFNFGLFGGYTLLENQLTGAYSHQTYHTLGTSIATNRSTTPVQDETDTGRIDYTFETGRITITPELSASAYRFGNTTVLGQTASQQYLDRDVVAGGVTTRYATTENAGFVLVVRGINSHFTNPIRGIASNNATSAVVLAGIDYQSNGLWRYQLLGGGELRTFQASQYATRVAPIVEGSVIYTPTNVATVTGLVSRAIDDPQAGGTNGFILSSGTLRLDYELRRDVILEAHTQYQIAEFLTGGGSQTSINGGVGATWLLNRNVHLQLSYDYTRQSGSGTTNAFLTGGNPNATNITYNVVGLTLHLAL